MDLFGSFALLLAFVCSLYAIGAGIVGIRTKNQILLKSARHAGIALCVLVMLGTASLVYLFYTNNFAMAYVVEHSSRDLPYFYKLPALWSGQQGSLLFWSFLLSMYTFFVLVLNSRKHPELMPYVGVILASVQGFFLILNNFVASPFALLATTGASGMPQVHALADGNGLNPLLQYPEMAIHPPNLYLGYTGFTIPFAFALAALLGRYPGEKWIHVTRRWTMVAWGFQSIGILLGMHWAYAVLGWGGYWAWDPVENASLMPWITGTAFLHSVMMQEKRGMMRVWNIWLVFITFMLCILGTFLTRSGVVSSVHAFAQSSIGQWFFGFLLLILGVCLAAYFKNRDYLKSDNHLDSMVSRESSFLFNNLILLAACFATLWGTLFPVISEAFTGNKISVGPPFFNKVNIPIGLFLLLLTGVGPLLAWRRTSVDSLRRNFGIPVIAGALSGVVFYALGYRDFYALICLILCVFVTLTILGEFFRGMRVVRARTGMNWFSSFTELSMRNTRRYGGYVIHLGIVFIFVGIAGAAFKQDTQSAMHPGDQMTIGPYRLICQEFEARPGPNYQAERATIEVEHNGKSLMMLYPERRLFSSGNGETGTMVAIYSTVREDLYVVYAGRDPQSNAPIIHAYLNPLVKWIWIGGLVVGIGTVLAILPNQRTAIVLSPAAQPLPGAAVSPQPAPLVSHYGSQD
ncbi:MAG TPA: heme lyase CcmF/NrfE family subunit [Candidatus Acidoferrales bacterium]|nr:heme lyase CcmF/NrfE family subunit [Candidatus Acidoferrales bacterium]